MAKLLFDLSAVRTLIEHAVLAPAHRTNRPPFHGISPQVPGLWLTHSGGFYYLTSSGIPSAPPVYAQAIEDEPAWNRARNAVGGDFAQELDLTPTVLRMILGPEAHGFYVTLARNRLEMGVVKAPMVPKSSKKAATSKNRKPTKLEMAEAAYEHASALEAEALLEEAMGFLKNLSPDGTWDPERVRAFAMQPGSAQILTEYVLGLTDDSPRVLS